MFGPTHPAAIICDTLAEVGGLISGEMWSIVPESSVPWFQRMGNYRVCELDPAPPIRAISKITHREPRVGAEKALKIFTNILKHPPEGTTASGVTLYLAIYQQFYSK